jgi:beta-lactamase superfamily II metal-dependent hydrolase
VLLLFEQKQLIATGSSWAISRVMLALMMETETVSETLDHNSVVTRLNAREDSVAIFRGYKTAETHEVE